MKQFLIFFLIFSGVYGHTQMSLNYDGPRAKTQAKYSQMFNDTMINIVRNHEEFIEIVKTDASLKAIFKKPSLLIQFLNDLTITKGGVASLSYGSLKEAYPKRYKEITDYILGHFGIGELFDKSSPTSAASTHLEGYACSCPDCVSSNDSACIFSICADHCKGGSVKGSDLDLRYMMR